MKKYMAAAIAALMLSAGTVFAAEPADNTGESAINTFGDTLKVQHFGVQYMMVTANSDKATKAINDDLAELGRRFTAKIGNQELSGGSLIFQGLHKTNRYLSMAVMDSWYNTGAAHGMYQVYGRVYDLYTGERKKVSDFVKIDVKTLDAMLRGGELQIMTINKTPLEMPYGADELWDVKDIPENFAVTEDGTVLLIYQVYELGPYAVGCTYIPIAPDIVARLNK